jgi:hypothetical protein
MEKDVNVAGVETKPTKSGNTRWVVHAEGGDTTRKRRMDSTTCTSTPSSPSPSSRTRRGSAPVRRTTRRKEAGWIPKPWLGIPMFIS